MQYRKKPVIIDAIQMTLDRMTDEDMEGWPTWLVDACGKEPTEEGSVKPFSEDGETALIIHTLEGTHKCDVGDWIIRGVAGELYPCKPDIFAQTYELANGNRFQDFLEQQAARKLMQIAAGLEVDLRNGKFFSDGYSFKDGKGAVRKDAKLMNIRFYLQALGMQRACLARGLWAVPAHNFNDDQIKYHNLIVAGCADKVMRFLTNFLIGEDIDDSDAMVRVEVFYPNDEDLPSLSLELKSPGAPIYSTNEPLEGWNIPEEVSA